MRFPEVAQAIDDIDEVVRAMDGSLADLNTSLDVKLAEWEGGAYGSYQDTKSMWMTSASDIKTPLTSIRNAVAASSERMAATEMANATALARQRA
jgi:WXG100 family type VII secretion target